MQSEKSFSVWLQHVIKMFCSIKCSDYVSGGRTNSPQAIFSSNEYEADLI